MIRQVVSSTQTVHSDKFLAFVLDLASGFEGKISQSPFSPAQVGSSHLSSETLKLGMCLALSAKNRSSQQRRQQEQQRPNQVLQHIGLNMLDGPLASLNSDKFSFDLLMATALAKHEQVLRVPFWPVN